MNRRIATLAAVAVLTGSAAAIPAASANSFGVSIGLPGFAVGYSNRGVGFIAGAPIVAAPYYAAPAVSYAPPAYYPAPVYYAAPVSYVAPVVVARPYYGPYYRPYYRPYYSGVRVGYYGHHRY